MGGPGPWSVTGNAVVKAETFDEGDARAVGRGGGFVDVGVSLADVEVTPSVSSTLADNAKLTATGNVTVTAM